MMNLVEALCGCRGGKRKNLVAEFMLGDSCLSCGQKYRAVRGA